MWTWMILIVPLLAVAAVACSPEDAGKANARSTGAAGAGVSTPDEPALATQAIVPRAGLSSAEADAAVRSVPTDSSFCQLAGPPAGTCTVGLSALIRCNGSSPQYTFAARHQVRAAFDVEWDPAEGRWLIEVRCRDDGALLTNVDLATFWYYEWRALIPRDTGAWLLFPESLKPGP